MMTIQSGEFWIANIPFTNGLSSKKRPVLVLWTDGNDAIVALVTSALPRTETDSMLNDWHSSGLRTASIVSAGLFGAVFTFEQAWNYFCG
jgi:mRNA interferase MazF